MDLRETKPRAKRRVLQEEEFNRDGHWVRNFTVRQEVWPIIEHWASEHGYRLTAMKAKKRTYQKGSNPSWYSTVIDMRQVENEFRFVAWIKVGFTARVAHLFQHPKEFQIQATGWKGAVVRRKACRELNVLLERLRQASIADSMGFHIADLDGATRLFAALAPVPIVFFLVGMLRLIDPNPLLALELLKTISIPFGILMGVALVFLGIQHFVISKRLPRALWKNVSVAMMFVSFSILSVFLFSRATLEMAQSNSIVLEKLKSLEKKDLSVKPHR